MLADIQVTGNKDTRSGLVTVSLKPPAAMTGSWHSPQILPVHWNWTGSWKNFLNASFNANRGGKYDGCGRDWLSEARSHLPLSFANSPPAAYMTRYAKVSHTEKCEDLCIACGTDPRGRRRHPPDTGRYWHDENVTGYDRYRTGRL